VAELLTISLRRRATAADAHRSFTEECAAEVHRDGTVVIPGGTFRIIEVGSGMYSVSREPAEPRPDTESPQAKDQGPWLTYVAASGADRWLFMNGVVYEFALGELHELRRDTPQHLSKEEALQAPMPATVTKVLVSVGQTVEEGDLVLVLEAMKMELPIRAPHAGVVKAVFCQEGQLVQPGVSLVDIV